MYRSGAGGFVAITKNADDQLDAPYDVEAWAASKEYARDDLVITNAVSGDEYQLWRALQDHTSDAAEKTSGAPNTTPDQLSATYWEKHETGTLLGLSSWTLTRGVTETNRRLLIESSPRTTYSTTAPTLELNLLDNYQGSRTQRILAVPNSNVYVKLYPTGKGTGLEVIQGNMRVGESTHDGGDGETDVSRTVTLAADGDFTSSTQA